MIEKIEDAGAVAAGLARGERIWLGRAKAVQAAQGDAAARPLFVLVLALRAAREGLEQDGTTPGVLAMLKAATELHAALQERWDAA
jgi:hypothetical protein